MGRERHGRQSRLFEVGTGGQARIETARVAVALDGLAGHVAARYLAGAGVGHLAVRTPALAAAAKAVDASVDVDVAPGPPAPFMDLDLRDPAARDVARGALVALAALRAALASPENPS